VSLFALGFGLPYTLLSAPYDYYTDLTDPATLPLLIIALSVFGLVTMPPRQHLVALARGQSRRVRSQDD
jgi:hypothetical protein